MGDRIATAFVACVEATSASGSMTSLNPFRSRSAASLPASNQDRLFRDPPLRLNSDDIRALAAGLTSAAPRTVRVPVESVVYDALPDRLSPPSFSHSQPSFSSGAYVPDEPPPDYPHPGPPSLSRTTALPPAPDTFDLPPSPHTAAPPPPAYSRTADRAAGESTVELGPRRPFQRAPAAPSADPRAAQAHLRETSARAGSGNPRRRPVSELSDFARDFYAVGGARVVPQSRYAPPPGDPPALRQRASSSASVGIRALGRSVADGTGPPTTKPMRGRALLNKGRILMYPKGFSCPACQNTGYHNSNPGEMCGPCWSNFARPFSAIFSWSPWGQRASNEAGDGRPDGDVTFQRPLVVVNPTDDAAAPSGSTSEPFTLEAPSDEATASAPSPSFPPTASYTPALEIVPETPSSSPAPIPAPTGPPASTTISESESPPLHVEPPTSPALFDSFPKSIMVELAPPTTKPTRGRVLLNKGKILVYPKGFSCPACQNTGYKSPNPQDLCKDCWSHFSRTWKAVSAWSPWGSRAGRDGQTEDFSFQCPFPQDGGPHEASTASLASSLSASTVDTFSSSMTSPAPPSASSSPSLPTASQSPAIPQVSEVASSMPTQVEPPMSTPGGLDTMGAPTTKPTRGRALLNKGKTLVYPRGFSCPACKNTGYINANPTAPCSQCWSNFGRRYSAVFAWSPWARGSRREGQSEDVTFQCPLPSRPGGSPEASTTSFALDTSASVVDTPSLSATTGTSTASAPLSLLAASERRALPALPSPRWSESSLFTPTQGEPSTSAASSESIGDNLVEPSNAPPPPMPPKETVTDCLVIPSNAPTRQDPMTDPHDPLQARGWLSQSTTTLNSDCSQI